MNQKQRRKQAVKKSLAQIASLRATQQPSSLPIDAATDPFNWVQPTIEALGRCLFAGELTAPMTHTPKTLVDAVGCQSILVRILHQGKYQTVCIGQPLSPEQLEEANQLFTDSKTIELKGN